MSPLTIITGTLLIYLVVRGRIGVYADLLKSPKFDTSNNNPANNIPSQNPNPGQHGSTGSW